jgi:hypothetical protein
MAAPVEANVQVYRQSGIRARAATLGRRRRAMRLVHSGWMPVQLAEIRQEGPASMEVRAGCSASSSAAAASERDAADGAPALLPSELRPRLVGSATCRAHVTH